MSEPMNEGEDIAQELRTTLKWLVLSTVFLFTVQAGIVGFVWIDATHRRADLEKVAISTNIALCALRSNLEQRVLDSIEFLRDNPDGIPGVSAELIQDNINSQQQTLTALSDLICTPPETGG